MNVYLSKNTELFYKALEDIWVAEQSWFVSPNIAVWSCTQAVEKTMKAFLRCLNIDYDHSHQLDFLLEDVLSAFTMTSDTKKYVLYLNDYGGNLRYKNMSTDPTPEDARIAIARAKHIMNEFAVDPKTKPYMDEAREVHNKIVKSSYDKYSDVDISGDKPES